MKQSVCEIFLNPNGHCDGVYHSGQKLSGHVLLTFYEKQKINSESCIYLQFELMKRLKEFQQVLLFIIENDDQFRHCSCSFQILWFKFLASANANGANNDVPIKVKKFT